MARSTFRSQNVQNTPFSEHFWKLRCRKSARRSGAKHISKSKCTKHTMVGALLKLEMSKKCTPLWREKVGNSRNTVFFPFPMICGSGGSKSRVAKAAGAEPSGQMRDEKVHAVVARSTFVSEKPKNTSRSAQFWKLRCRKSARRCGAKHISKSKCTKHLNLATLLEVEMSKKCTPLWREAHFKVKMLKIAGVWTTPLLDVQMSFRVAGARDCAPSQK